MQNSLNDKWTVIDLFSGAGGMSYGFHAHPDFEVVAAVDAQIAKPSSSKDSLKCSRRCLTTRFTTPFAKSSRVLHSRIHRASINLEIVIFFLLIRAEASVLREKLISSTTTSVPGLVELEITCASLPVAIDALTKAYSNAFLPNFSV